jgi:very-short-patch-repair endonuclease
VLDVAAEEGPRTGERMLAEALRRRRATEAEVRSVVSRSFGHRGIGVVGRLIDHGAAFDRSVAERLLLELVRRAGLPEPRTNAKVGRFEVDVLWPAFDVVVEFDSFTFHGDVVAFRRDRRKTAALEAAGYVVVPVIWDDLVHRPEVVVAAMSSVLAIAGTRRR